jgi:hypothetical protein
MLLLMLAVCPSLIISRIVDERYPSKIIIKISSKRGNKPLPMGKSYQLGLLGLPYVPPVAKLTIVQDYHRWRSHPNGRDPPVTPDL